MKIIFFIVLNLFFISHLNARPKDFCFKKVCYLNASRYLTELMETLPPPRALYAENMSRMDIHDYSLSNYFALALASPIVLTLDSEVYVKDKIFEFNAVLNEIHQQFNFFDLTDGLSKVPDSHLNRQVALKSIQSAVSVLLQFVPLAEKAELQDLLRQVGQVYLDPSSLPKIKDVIAKLESPASPLQKLNSPKSAFLIDVINLAKDWLKKVK